VRENQFINEKKDKWSQFETEYESANRDPRKLSENYIDLIEDLGYSQTFYNRRSVRVYLNQLVQKVFLDVHKHRDETWRKVLKRIMISLPIEIYKARKTLLFSLIAFLVYLTIGIITTHFNPDFPRIVLGDYYVDMTLDNIARGNPLAVYEMEEQGAMFITITLNNLKVAFLTFFWGLFLTIGTHIFLFYNGTMLGAFQYFFYTKGLLVTSFLGIWIHGAFEISAIVLAAGAGITAGSGFLFPKGYSRLVALRLSTIRGLKILLSLVPFIILAGFIESYITRNYLLFSDLTKWFFIMLCFALIALYYIFLPIYVARKYPEYLKEDEYVAPSPTNPIELFKIRSIMEVIRSSVGSYFSILKSSFAKIMLIVVPAFLVATYIQSEVHLDKMVTKHWFDWYVQTQIIFGYGRTALSDYLIGLLWSLVFTYVFICVAWSIRTTYPQGWVNSSFWLFLRQKFRSTYWMVGATFWLFFFIPIEFKFIIFFLIPLFATTPSFNLLNDLGDTGTSYKAGFRNYGYTLVLIIFFTVLTFLFAQPIAAFTSMEYSSYSPPLMRDLLDLLCDFLERILIFFTEDYTFVSNIVRQFVYVLFIFLALPFYVIMMSFMAINDIEKETAIGLKNDYIHFGNRKKYTE